MWYNGGHLSMGIMEPSKMVNFCAGGLMVARVVLYAMSCRVSFSENQEELQ